MGLLILIGMLPIAYALNRASPDSAFVQFQQTSQAAAKVVEEKAAGYNFIGNLRPAVWRNFSARILECP